MECTEWKKFSRTAVTFLRSLAVKFQFETYHGHHNLKEIYVTVIVWGLWGVLNNAGILGPIGAPEWMTIDDYRTTCEVNTFGLIDVTMTFLPLVKKSRGRIVNTSSINGLLSVPLCVPYCVSKYGVEAFTDALRCYHHHHHILLLIERAIRRYLGHSVFATREYGMAQ